MRDAAVFAGLVRVDLPSCICDLSLRDIPTLVCPAGPFFAQQINARGALLFLEITPPQLPRAWRWWWNQAASLVPPVAAVSTAVRRELT